MIKVLKSLLLTFIVSTIFAFIFIDSFWNVFIITTLSQLILFYFFNTIYEGYVVKKAMELNISLEEEKSKNNVILSCPSCVHRQTIEMNLTRAFTYKCDKCGSEIKAEPSVKNYLVTNPIYVEK